MFISFIIGSIDPGSVAEINAANARVSGYVRLFALTRLAKKNRIIETVKVDMSVPSKANSKVPPKCLNKDFYMTITFSRL